VIIGVLVITAVASLMKTRRDERKSAEETARSPLEAGDTAADQTSR
jgi:hypothetical protein